VILLASGVVCLLMGLRAIQLGLRTAYFRHRRDRIVAGWWLVGSAALLIVVGLLVFRVGDPLFSLPRPLFTSTPQAAPSADTSTATSRALSTPFPTQTRPAPSTPTSAPILPLSIEALITSQVTPGPDAAIAEIRFSPVMDGQLAQNPSARWRNPIRQMYAAFKYSGMTPGAQFTALWFRDGQIVYIDTRPWGGGPSGRSFSLWQPEQPYDLLPGAYEVQFFVGHQYLTSAAFTLTGKPVQPTPTLTPRPSRTPSFTPTSSRIPSITPTPTPTSTPRPTSTATPVPPSKTPSPTSTFTFTPTLTFTPSRTPTPTFTFTPTRTPTSTFTFTSTFTPTRTFTPTVTFTPSRTPTLIYTALPTDTPLYQKVTVYFVDSQRLAAGLIPPEVGVARYTASANDPLPFLLQEYFKGPRDAETRSGLIAIYNGFTGYSRLSIEDGVLRIYLKGACEFSPQGYSIAQALIANLKQFPQAQFVKIYDENGQTRSPSGRSDSAPACLGFSSLLDPTRTPTTDSVR
jgi:type VI secretion system secreted protein VgrG